MRIIFFFFEITVSCDRVLHLHQINPFAQAYNASTEFTFNLLSFINDEMDLGFGKRKTKTFCCEMLKQKYLEVNLRGTNTLRFMCQ